MQEAVHLLAGDASTGQGTCLARSPLAPSHPPTRAEKRRGWDSLAVVGRMVWMILVMNGTS